MLGGRAFYFPCVVSYRELGFATSQCGTWRAPLWSRPRSTNDTLTCIQNIPLIPGHMLGNIYLSEINARDSFTKYFSCYNSSLPPTNCLLVVTILLLYIFMTQWHHDMTWDVNKLRSKLWVYTSCHVRILLSLKRNFAWVSGGSEADSVGLCYGRKEEPDQICLGVFTLDKTEVCLVWDNPNESH